MDIRDRDTEQVEWRFTVKYEPENFWSKTYDPRLIRLQRYSWPIYNKFVRSRLLLIVLTSKRYNMDYWAWILVNTETRKGMRRAKEVRMHSNPGYLQVWIDLHDCSRIVKWQGHERRIAAGLEAMISVNSTARLGSSYSERHALAQLIDHEPMYDAFHYDRMV